MALSSDERLEKKLAEFRAQQDRKKERDRKNIKILPETREKLSAAAWRNNALRRINEKYQPFKEQRKIHDALKPYQSGLVTMAITGRRFGKTTVAVNEVIERAVKIPYARIWYIAHTEKQAFRIAWNLMLKKRTDKQGKVYDPYLDDNLIEKKREDQHIIRLKNGTLIEFLGTTQELPMLGAGLHFVVFDEFPAIPWTVWYDTVRPMLADFNGDALFIGTVPDPVRHNITPQFIDMYEELLYGTKRTKNKAFNYSSFRNPHISHKKLKEDIEDLKRKGKESDANRLYYGKYSKASGRVFPQYNYKKHTVSGDMVIPPDWWRIMAIDPHPQKPSRALWAAIDPRNHLWFYREYEFIVNDRPMTVPEISYEITMIETAAKEKIKARLFDPTYGKVEEKIKGAKSVKELFSDNGLIFQEASRDFDTFYHEFGDRLATDPEPTVHILRTLTVFLWQLERYMWDSYVSARAREERGIKNRPKKVNDDYVDCAKYIINSNVRYISMGPIKAFQDRLKQKWREKRFL